MIWRGSSVFVLSLFHLLLVLSLPFTLLPWLFPLLPLTATSTSKEQSTTEKKRDRQASTTSTAVPKPATYLLQATNLHGPLRNGSLTRIRTPELGQLLKYWHWEIGWSNINVITMKVWALIHRILFLSHSPKRPRPHFVIKIQNLR